MVIPRVTIFGHHQDQTLNKKCRQFKKLAGHDFGQQPASSKPQMQLQYESGLGCKH